MNGLPALAQDLASRGRNGDTMLVHMTPGEVQGLQALAYTQGGSLSINPDTGLVEANFLKRMLPMLAGAALTIGSGGVINPFTAGMIVGGVETVRTGDVGKGFMAGLGAYGGAGLGAGFANAGATAAPAVPTAAPAAPGVDAALTPAANITAQPAASYAGGNLSATATAPVSTTTAAPSAIGERFATAGRGFEALGTESGRTAFIGTPATAATPTTAAAPATGVGGYSGLAKSTLASAAPFMVTEPAPPPTPEDPYANYKGPVAPSERAVSYPTDAERRRRGTSEFTYFTPSNPIPYADGGSVMQNIANVQNMAGIPAIGAALPAMPQQAAAPRAGMVYNPIETQSRGLVYNPIAATGSVIPAREAAYGFRPVEMTGVPEDLKEIYKSTDSEGGMFADFLRNSKFAADVRTPRVQYEYDAATQTIRPTQAFLDAIEARRQQVAAEQAAAAEAAAAASNMGGFAYGGSVPTLEEGGFVLTKKAVDGLGGGDNKRGQQVAQKNLGAKPIRGPGTGTSDSIRTSIAGKQPALVSNGEAYVPAKKVKQNGGAKAFYELMARAEKAAKA